MWPGNTADVTTLIPVVDRLRRRFAIGRVCVVADRGLNSAETIAALEARELLYTSWAAASAPKNSCARWCWPIRRPSCR
jgi:transposase